MLEVAFRSLSSCNMERLEKTQYTTVIHNNIIYIYICKLNIYIYLYYIQSYIHIHIKTYIYIYIKKSVL